MTKRSPAGEEFRHAGEELRYAGYDIFVNALRAGYHQSHAPWLERPLPPTLHDTALGRLFALLHQGRAQDATFTNANPVLVRALERAGLIRHAPERAQPGAWFLTAYRDLLAVRDRSNDGSLDSSKVYIGEDSLRFVDWISTHQPVDSALDLGSGSGISSAAIAKLSRTTLAVDIDESCCAATRLTAALNGMASSVEVVQADMADGSDLAGTRKFDLVVCNPPDVPVPGDMDYSKAGYGGADGLLLIHSTLERTPAWLSSRGALRMHFHAIGDEVAPFVTGEIEKFAAQYGWNVVLVHHSRVPIAVRSAITARWAKAHNETKTLAELLRLCDAHAARLGATHFYGCTLVARAGQNRDVTVLPLHRDRPLQTSFRPSQGRRPLGDADVPAVAAAYANNLRTLPDGVYELEVERYRFAPILNLGPLWELLAAGASLGDAAEKAFAAEFTSDPVHARVLYVLVMKLVDSLTELELVDAEA